MTVAFIGVGSNVGDRLNFCRAGVGALGEWPGISVIAVSGLYETSPLGGPPQRSFVNCVAKAETSLTPRELLHAAKAVEQRLGREPSSIRWGPRVVDLDILLYGEEKVNDPDLTIPHARLQERRFALVPLVEVDPEAADPWGMRYADLVDEAEGDVRLLEPF